MKFSAKHSGRERIRTVQTSRFRYVCVDCYSRHGSEVFGEPTGEVLESGDRDTDRAIENLCPGCVADRRGTRGTARDPQQIALYRAQGFIRSIPRCATSFGTTRGAQAYLDKIANRLSTFRTYTTRTPFITRRGIRSKRFAGRIYPGGLIEVNLTEAAGGGVSALTIVHEYAHAMTPNADRSGMEYGHGPLFVAMYAVAIGVVFGSDVFDRFMEAVRFMNLEIDLNALRDAMDTANAAIRTAANQV